MRSVRQRAGSRAIAIAGVCLCTAGLIAAGLAYPGGSVAADSWTTKLGLSKKGPAFHGDTRSDAQICIRHRRVTMIERLRGEPNRIIGRTWTNRRGRWFVDGDTDANPLASGEFFAKVAPKTKPGRGKCLGDRSRTVVVD